MACTETPRDRQSSEIFPVSQRPAVYGLDVSGRICNGDLERMVFLRANRLRLFPGRYRAMPLYLAEPRSSTKVLGAPRRIPSPVLAN